MGEGFSINRGTEKYGITKDSNLINKDISFSNLIGLQAGLLFSSKIINQQSISSFAIYRCLNILDLQLGIGHKFGYTSANQRRTFISVSYGIPISKLDPASSYMIKSKHVVNLDKCFELNIPESTDEKINQLKEKISKGRFF